MQTIDLYESRDLAQVQVTLYKLGSAAQKNDFPGPVIGVRVAEKNIRKFDERRKREGMNVIGLQVRSELLLSVANAKHEQEVSKERAARNRAA